MKYFKIYFESTHIEGFLSGFRSDFQNKEENLELMTQCLVPWMITGVNTFSPVLSILPDQEALENLLCSAIIWWKFVKISHWNIFRQKSTFSNEISISPQKSQKLHFNVKLCENLKHWSFENQKWGVWFVLPHPSAETLLERVLPWSYKTCKHSFDSVPSGKIHSNKALFS